MLKATIKFSAAFGREVVSMEKGEQFKGSDNAAERLKAMGLLEEAPRRRAKKEE